MSYNRPYNKNDQKYKINEGIRSRDVFLIDENGNAIGNTPLEEAIQISTERGLDLVEVGPNASPPICKILDYGKFKYEQQKKTQKSKSKSGEIKEIRLGVNIEEHDYNTRVQHAEKFINKGHKIRVTVKMTGRENIYANRAHELIEDFRQKLSMQYDQKPVRMGTRISATLIKERK